MLNAVMPSAPFRYYGTVRTVPYQCNGRVSALSKPAPYLITGGDLLRWVPRGGAIAPVDAQAATNGVNQPFTHWGLVVNPYTE